MIQTRQQPPLFDEALHGHRILVNLDQRRGCEDLDGDGHAHGLMKAPENDSG
jgi:hypothetical protein